QIGVGIQIAEHRHTAKWGQAVLDTGSRVGQASLENGLTGDLESEVGLYGQFQGNIHPGVVGRAAAVVDAGEGRVLDDALLGRWGGGSRSVIGALLIIRDTVVAECVRDAG